MAEHHAHDRPWRRAKRHPNADLTCAERHEVRHHAVDAEAGEQQRKSCEPPQQHQRQFSIGGGLRNARGEHLRLQQRQIRVQRS
jgi:hypothetical protein